MNGTLDYNAACIDAAKHQMPHLWAQDEATVRQYLWQTGGFTMALGRVTDEATGAHIMLTEGWAGDDTYAIWSYSSADCEGHEITSATSASNALWWFLNGTVPAGPCPCDPATPDDGAERIKATASDDWECLCGNRPDLDGFYPYADGREVEPDSSDWDGVRYFCASCFRIIDQNTLIVLERPASVVMLDA